MDEHAAASGCETKWKRKAAEIWDRQRVPKVSSTLHSFPRFVTAFPYPHELESKEMSTFICSQRFQYVSGQPGFQHTFKQKILPAAGIER